MKAASLAAVLLLGVAAPATANTVPDWFWSWAHWKTSHHGPRPAAAPAHVPAWAWRLLARHRTVLPAPAGLSSDERALANAARAHVQDLRANSAFTHDFVKSGVTSPWPTWVAWYYPSPCVGEDLARAATPATAVQLWLASPPHRANLLSGMFTTMGVGSANGVEGILFGGC
jgi:hypothetical protein